ncbi:MAG: ArnT family glycosyltransferase [Methylophilaceae bacterium]
MNRHHLAIAGLWLLLVVIALNFRSYIPIDETRYVAVAWGMWLRGDFLVPYLNNIPYSHKPPLLFWLMNAGWAMFGVNDWWPRLVPSLFALGSIFLTGSIARRLWPQLPQVAQIAQVILLGSGLWMVFTTATMFDMMVAFFTLFGMLAILIAWQEKTLKGWLLLGLAIGGGLLAKGPTILMQLLPLALLAPWWGRDAKPTSWPRWIGGVLAAVLLGAVIALIWAIPAGIRGGSEYQHAIFWGQTADRMVNSFAHRRPLWWYVPLLPLLLFPWLLWLPFWRGLRQLVPFDFGMRFCLAWLIPVFIAFSFISGKQVHYLLPIFPAFALLAARALVTAEPRPWDAWPAALAIAIAAGILAYLPSHVHSHQMAVWFGALSIWPSCILAALAMIALFWRGRLMVEVWKMTLISATVVCVMLYWAIVHSSGVAYDMHPIAQHLKTLQERNIPLAHLGKYAGQYQFVGRLTREPEVLEYGKISDWFAVHPDGRVILYFSSELPLQDILPEYEQAYRGDHVVVVGLKSWELLLKHPEFKPGNQ